MSGDGNLGISFTADEKDLLKAQAKVIKQQDQVIEKYRKMAQEAKKGGKDAEKATADAGKEMDRFAAATMKVNRTPIERYKEEMFRLNAALKAGKIDQESFNRATASAKMQLEQAGQAGRKAFGAQAIASLSGYLTSMLSIGAVVAGISKTFRDAMQIADEMASKQQGAFEGTGALAQLAMGDKQAMKKMLEESRASFAQGAGMTMGEAADIQFAITSASQQKYRQQIAELKASGAIKDTKAMVQSAAGFETAMGTDTTGGFPKIVSLALGASQFTRTEMPELLAAMSVAAPFAKRVGFKPEEVGAATTTLSKAYPVEEAGTYLKNFSVALDKEVINKGILPAGKSLEEYVTALSAMEAKGTNIWDIIPEIRAVAGYSTLKENLPIYRQALGGISKATEEDAFRATTEMWKTSPELIAPRAQKQAAARKEIAYEREATFTNLSKAVRDDIQAAVYQKFGRLAAAGYGATYAAQEMLYGPEQMARENMFSARPETAELVIRAMATYMTDAAADHRAAAAELRDAAEQNSTARQRAAANAQPE